MISHLHKFRTQASPEGVEANAFAVFQRCLGGEWEGSGLCNCDCNHPANNYKPLNWLQPPADVRGAARIGADKSAIESPADLRISPAIKERKKDAVHSSREACPLL